MNITFRQDELSYKEFTQLTKSDKQKYLELLAGIDEDYLSYNDKYILLNYSTNKPAPIKNKFLEL